jgi:hypothetical protein
MYYCTLKAIGGMSVLLNIESEDIQVVYCSLSSSVNIVVILS